MEQVIVIAGGPAGVTAALRARELRAAVAWIEGGTWGGACTNSGLSAPRPLAEWERKEDHA